MSKRWFSRSIAASLLCLFSPVQNFADAGSVPAHRAAWNEEELEFLATAREREKLRELTGESEREMFIQGFWQARDPYPQTPRNELREQWESRMQVMHQRWGSLQDDRSRVVLLQGEATTAFVASCPETGTFEVWVYEPRYRAKYRTVLVFQEDGTGSPARLWQPGPGAVDLAAAATEACTHREKLAEEAKWIRWAGAESYKAMMERALAKPRPREWISSFQPIAVDAPSQGASFNAGLYVDYAGRMQDKVVVRVLLAVAPESLPQGQAVPVRNQHEFLLAGQVLAGNGAPESFLYRFRARPRAAAAGPQAIPLTFERYLAPGRYQLRVKLEHLPTQSYFLGEKEIEVPEVQVAKAVPGPEPTPAASATPAGTSPEAATVVPSAMRSPALAPAAAEPPELTRLYAEADATLSADRPGLRLLVPPGALLTGNVRFAARVDYAPGLPQDQQIRKVAFSLDGKRLLVRNHPPYEMAVDLGPLPRPQRLRVDGLGAGGEVLATDEVPINTGAQQFRVRLLEPRQGVAYRDSLRALATVEAPEGAKVERVELYLGEDLIATLYQPPYALPVALEQRGEVGYLRAVAYLAGGGAAEDVVLLNVPDPPDKLDVHLVELYTTVVDKAGRPVTTGFGPDKITVLEDGVRQSVRQVEHVGDNPVRLVTLIDTSGSMRGQMDATRQAALGFLRRTLRPRDQAAVITFNTSPEVSVPLTNDLSMLEEGLTGLLAEDETSLYDSLVYSLYYLTGARGQRAVLLLSDGLDRSSRYTFEQAVECARRAGITVYAIGLNLPEGPGGEPAQKLKQLAEVTGGQSFFAAGTGDLEGVYAAIEKDLRSQYRIAYQSANTAPNGPFRTVQVKVAQSGLDARTISGYYP